MCVVGKEEWHRWSFSALNYAELHPETDRSVFNLFMAPSSIKQSEPPSPSSAEICKWSSDRTRKITSPQFSDQHTRKEDTFSLSWLALCFWTSCPSLDQFVPLVKPGNSHVKSTVNTDVSVPSIFTATPGCLHLFQWLMHLQKFCYPHIKWITSASSMSADTILGLPAKKIVV